MNVCDFPALDAAELDDLSGINFGDIAQPWPKCEPLPMRLAPVAPFDYALLPDAFRPWIRDVSERMQCPPDYPAASALVCLASVVGRQIAIRPKRRDDWTVVPNLWGAIVGRPSLLKTPALQEAMKGIDALEAGAREEHAREHQHFAAEQLVADAQTKEAKTRDRAGVQGGNADLAHQHALDAGIEPEAPARRRYRTNDTTVEKLGELLRDNPRGIARLP